MKKLYLFALLFVLVLGVENSYSQRILVNENFESAGLSPDSLPSGWLKAPEIGPNPTYPLAVWSVRDSGSFFPGVNGILHSRAHSFRRGISIPWRAAQLTPPNADIADGWVFTDSMTIRTGDSLIFWMLFGTPLDIPSLTHYIDTMQVRVCTIPVPEESFSTRLASIRSLDSDNVWTEYKFSLDQFAGQLVYISFRYYMDTSVDGLWCNIDDVFIGNRSAVGITPVGTNVPTQFALKQNYPNPFNPLTHIKFDLPKNTEVDLTVFNSNGQEVMKLASGNYKAGSYDATFDAKTLPSGTYFYRLTTKEFVQTKKMTLVK
jgi:hypothetical protein